MLIPFTSTPLWECGFPALTMNKSKYHSGLQVEDDLRLFLYAVHHSISRLCSLEKKNFFSTEVNVTKGLPTAYGKRNCIFSDVFK